MILRFDLKKHIKKQISELNIFIRWSSEDYRWGDKALKGKELENFYKSNNNKIQEFIEERDYLKTLL